MAFFLKKSKLNGVSQIAVNYQTAIVDIWIDEIPSVKKNLFSKEKTTNLIVRNRPHGKLEMVDSHCVPLSTKIFFLRRVSVPAEKAETKPFQEPFLWQCRLKLRDPKALFTKNGYLSHGNMLKIGTRINLEGQFYRVDGFIVNVYQEKN